MTHAHLKITNIRLRPLHTQDQRPMIIAFKGLLSLLGIPHGQGLRLGDVVVVVILFDFDHKKLLSMAVPKRSDIKALGVLPKFAHFEFPRASLKCFRRLPLLFA